LAFNSNRQGMCNRHTYCFIFLLAPIYVILSYVTTLLTSVSNTERQNKILLPYHLHADEDRTVHNYRILKSRLFSPLTARN